MKKKIVLLTLLLLLCFTEKVFAADITVVVGDKELSQKGTVIAGQVMVPAYEVAGYLGIGASYEENILWISINDNFIAKMQGNIYSLAVPGQYGQWTDFTSNGVLQYINDIVFIPVDAASVMLDADFNYNSTENEIIVKSRKVKTPSVVYTVSGTVLVTVDGKKLPQNGVIVNGRTMVPIRDIAEAIGLNVIFDNRTGRVELVKDNLFIGDMVSDSYSIAEWKPNKEGQYERDVHYYDSDVPMQNIDGKSMIPLKVAAEMLNADINWDATNRVASITSKQSVVSGDGKIDLMPALLKLKGVEQQPLIEKGFEIKELTAEKDESKNGWWIRCKFDNVSGRSLSAAVYLLVYDKQTGKLIEAGPRDYDDDWAMDGGWITAQIFYKYDPQLHDVDVDIS